MNCNYYFLFNNYIIHNYNYYFLVIGEFLPLSKEDVDKCNVIMTDDVASVVYDNMENMSKKHVELQSGILLLYITSARFLS